MKERRSKPTSMRAKKNEGVVCFVSLCRRTDNLPYRQGQERRTKNKSFQIKLTILERNYLYV